MRTMVSALLALALAALAWPGAAVAAGKKLATSTFIQANTPPSDDGWYMPPTSITF